MNLNYRPLTEADLDSVLAMEAVAHEAPWTRGNFQDSFKSGHHMLAMEAEGELCGYAVVMPLPDEAELLNITIAPLHQQQGLGMQLLNHLCAKAQAGGAGQLFLEVRESNTAARALYAKAGFTEIGRRRGYYACRDGRREDAILMAKEL